VAAIENNFVERVAHFGPGKSLIGIVAKPVALSTGDKPAVVILNTGTVHRVGHHRMYVSMSRKLAKAGHTVLRFDFSGLGDSATHGKGQPLLQSNLADIGAALDWLETTFQVSRVILVGLCSGADHAVLFGHSEPRVVGLVLIDPYIPATARYYIDYLSLRLFNPRSWKRFRFRNSRLIARLFEGRLFYRSSKNAEPNHLTSSGLNAREALEDVYHATVKARVQLLVISTGRHHAPRVTYREQFIKAFASVSFDNLLQLHFFEDADHTFSSLKERDRLDDLIERWCQTTKFDRAVSGNPLLTATSI
jgi:pimeloyl-ACP methyl ester carboxylesterase